MDRFDVVLDTVSGLVCDDFYSRSRWVEKNRKRLQVSWEPLERTMDEINYLVVLCYAPIYVVDGVITRLEPQRDCIRGVHPAETIEQVLYKIFSFPTVGFVVFKKTERGFEEVSLKICCPNKNGGFTEKAMISPFENGDKVFVSIEDKTYECEFMTKAAYLEPFKLKITEVE